MKSFGGRGDLPLVQLAIMDFCKRERHINEIAAAFKMTYEATVSRLHIMRCAGRVMRIRPGLYRSVE